MARCEDFPCCGHEDGCCPDYDASGRQLNIKCICGATLPLDSPCSICDTCLRAGEDFDYEDTDRYGEEEDFEDFEDFEVIELDQASFEEDY
jgi:hypothetical protein